MLICNGTWMTMVLIWMKSKSWSIHRLTLYVTFKDGTEKEYENWNETSIDYKHGLEEVLVFDEDWNKHKGGNDKMI